MFRPDRYRQRNNVERLMNRRKQFRAVATRYDSQTDITPPFRSPTSSSGYAQNPTTPADPRSDPGDTP
jgi:transposase